jgi:hypothetical protein
MLHGVFFPEDGDDRAPMYTNRHLATPILSLSLLLARSPLPSISLLISPLSSLHRIITAILHTFMLALEARVGTLSVANTNVLWWGSGLGMEANDEVTKGTADVSGATNDIKTTGVKAVEERDGRLLALCESGPPLEVRVPELETVDWDRLKDKKTGQDLRDDRKGWGWRRWGLGRIQEVNIFMIMPMKHIDRGSPLGLGYRTSSRRSNQWRLGVLRMPNVRNAVCTCFRY